MTLQSSRFLTSPKTRSSLAFHALAEILTETYKTVEEAYENKVLVTGVPTGYHDLDV